MLTFLGGLESCFEHLVFALGDGGLCHGETDSELGGSDIAGAESVKVTEELFNTDSLLLALSADASDNIINIIRGVTDDLGLAVASLSLGVVVGAVVEALVHTEELLGAIDVLAEVLVVDLIDVSLVHVTAEELLSDGLRSVDSEEVENTKELGLSHVTVTSNIVVLEDRLEVDTLVLDSDLVLFEDGIDLIGILLTSKVLSAGKKGISWVDCSNSGGRSLVNASNCESAVHVSNEISVTEETLRISSLILLGQSLEFIVGQGKVHL